jgi:hypothetical protein
MWKQLDSGRVTHAVTELSQAMHAIEQRLGNIEQALLKDG